MNRKYLKTKLDCIEAKLCALVDGQQAIVINTNAATVESNLEALQTKANDLVKTFSYLDAGDPTNRRVDTIVYLSAALSLTVTKTFVYAGAPGDFYVSTITLS